MNRNLCYENHVSRLTSHVSRLLAVFFLSSSVAVFAQTNDWTLATGGYWNDTANWSLGSVPNAIDTEIGIDLDGTQTINLQGGTYTIGRLTSEGTTNTTTISNGTLKLETSSGKPLFDITKDTTISAILDTTEFKKTGSGTLTLGVANAERYYKIEAAQGITQFSLTNYSTNRVTGKIISDIDIASGAIFRGFDATTNNPRLEWTGKLTGSGTFTLINGTGRHTVNMDASGFTGTFSAGGSIIVLIAKDYALGHGGPILNSVPILSDSATDRILDNSVTLSNNLTIFGDSTNYAANTGKLTFTRGLNLLNNVDRTIRVDGIVVEIQGAVTRTLSGSGYSVTKTGSGTLIFSGADPLNKSNYGKNTIVSAGTLLVTGHIYDPLVASNFQVKSNAILGGTGTIDGRPISIETAGILAPGNSTAVNTTGTLTVNADITFAQGAIFRLELNSDTAYDKMVMGSMYDLTFNGLGATLDLHLNDQFDFLENMEFTIVQGFGYLNGQFTGISDNDVFTRDGVAFRMNYLSDSIKLTVVPEPSILALIGLALTGALVFRRRA